MAINAQLKWTDGFQFVARPEGAGAIVLDGLNGRSGPTPMEMVLLGVAGCTAMDVISVLEKKRQSVTDFQINIAGDQSETHPKRFTTIRIEYVVTGEVKPAALERAIELSNTKYCSAMASINAEVSHSYRIEEPS